MDIQEEKNDKAEIRVCMLCVFRMCDKRNKMKYTARNECLLNWKNKEQNTSAHNRTDCVYNIQACMDAYNESATQMRAMSAPSARIISETDRERCRKCS